MSAQANNTVRHITIAVDEDTLRRLLDIADMCHADIKSIAASLLHDILADDEAAHVLEAMPVVGHA